MAIKRVLAQKGPDITARRIVVLPGRYAEQFAVIEDLPDELPLAIAAAKGERPVFDGNGRGRTWLVLKSPTGKPTRVTIEGLEVTNYVTAISFNGDRASEGSLQLRERCARQRVSQDRSDCLPFGQAVDCGDPPGQLKTESNFPEPVCRHSQYHAVQPLHAIYMAHYSSNNLIERNTFERGCGATVKTRDASNDNMIRNNRFIEQRDTLFVDSYCNKDVRDDCTKRPASARRGAIPSKEYG